MADGPPAKRSAEVQSTQNRYRLEWFLGLEEELDWNSKWVGEDGANSHMGLRKHAAKMPIGVRDDRLWKAEEPIGVRDDRPWTEELTEKG